MPGTVPGGVACDIGKGADAAGETGEGGNPGCCQFGGGTPMFMAPPDGKLGATPGYIGGIGDPNPLAPAIGDDGADRFLSFFRFLSLALLPMPS